MSTYGWQCVCDVYLDTKSLLQICFLAVGIKIVLFTHCFDHRHSHCLYPCIHFPCSEHHLFPLPRTHLPMYLFLMDFLPLTPLCVCCTIDGWQHNLLTVNKLLYSFVDTKTRTSPLVVWFLWCYGTRTPSLYFTINLWVFWSYLLTFPVHKKNLDPTCCRHSLTKNLSR